MFLLQPSLFGTKALVYMDIVTIYFALLPFLLLYAISFAKKGEYKKHQKAQTIILVITLIMVVIFEVGVRISGGFADYSKESSISYTFLVSFLIIHIIIAIIAVILWIYFLISSIKSYKKKSMKKHKKMGILIFVLLSITSLMGCMMYLFLFVY